MNLTFDLELSLSSSQRLCATILNLHVLLRLSKPLCIGEQQNHVLVASVSLGSANRMETASCMLLFIVLRKSSNKPLVFLWEFLNY